jgi:hypothetical protein
MFYWADSLYSYSKIYSSLSPNTRLIVDLRIIGYKPAFIAKHIKKSKNTVKVSLYRAKKRFCAAFCNEYLPFGEKGTQDIYGRTQLRQIWEDGKEID